MVETVFLLPLTVLLLTEPVAAVVVAAVAEALAEKVAAVIPLWRAQPTLAAAVEHQRLAVPVS
jgi:hypothetical protein